jgi:hypothetical protein
VSQATEIRLILTRGGARVGVNMIFMNVSSFAFTGMIYTTQGGFDQVGNRVAAFAGLNQSQILASSIIHELLHAVGAIPSDGASLGQSGANSSTVRDACF